MEFFTDPCRADWLPVWPSKDQPVVHPAVSGRFLLSLLAALMCFQCTHYRDRHRDCAPAPRCLRLDELRFAINTLQLLRDLEVTKAKVDIMPAKAQRLTLSEAHRECNGVQGLEAITLH